MSRSSESREAEFPQHSEGTASLKPAQTCEEVYSATLEALRNVEKYARASKTSVHGEVRDGFALVSVRDDGQGFEFHPSFLERPGHIGLKEEIFGRIQERLGGTVAVRTRPGGGTDVDMRVPLPGKPSPWEDMPGPGA